MGYLECMEHLRKLSFEIRSLPFNNKKRLELIKHYNDTLDDILPFLKKPLPEVCELSDDLILDEYRKFRDYYSKNGYYTFERFIRDVDLIAEVKINKVKKRGTVIYADVIKLYKGQVKSTFVFDTIESWKPPKWFQTKENCFVFLFRRKSSDEYFGNSRKSKMSIITENNEQYVVCYDSEPEFWGNTNTIVISNDLGSGICKVLYEDVINKILTLKE